MDAINGQPGVFLHAFPVKVLLIKKQQKTSFAFKQHPDGKEGQFRRVMALIYPNGKIYTARTRRGRILTGLSAIGFGYDQYLFPMATMKPSQ